MADAQGARAARMIKAFLLRVATPGGLPAGLVETASFFVLVALCASEIALGSEFWLHALYIFPLVAIAIHCRPVPVVLVGLLLTVGFQWLAILSSPASRAATVTSALVALAWSVLAVLLGRFARTSYFEMANLANQDSLTGLPNRRHFERIVDMEIERQRRYAGVFSLAIADLDNFKSLNDSRGHFVGDQALRLIGRVLRESTRQSDLIARLGGDEFGILMPNTGDAESKIVCGKLSAIVASAMRQAGYATSASVGSVSFERAPESTSAAMQTADAAMYAVKVERKGSAATSGVPRAAARG